MRRLQENRHARQDADKQCTHLKTVSDIPSLSRRRRFLNVAKIHNYKGVWPSWATEQLPPDDMHSQLYQFTEFRHVRNVPRHQFLRKLQICY